MKVLPFKGGAFGGMRTRCHRVTSQKVRRGRVLIIQCRAVASKQVSGAQFYSIFVPIATLKAFCRTVINDVLLYIINTSV